MDETTSIEELPTLNSFYDEEKGVEYALEDTVARARAEAAARGLGQTVIISNIELNPAEDYGGTWTYHEGMHLFAGLKVYTKEVVE